MEPASELSAPAVEFPDAALVEQLARLEAPQPRAPIVFAWAKGIAWALVLALAGAAVLAWVTVSTGTQYGIIAIVIGLAAGFGAAKGGRTKHAQIVGAAAAAIGYFASLVMTAAGIVGWNAFSSLPIDKLGELTWIMIKTSLQGTGVLFLAIAMFEGWRIPKPR